MLCPAAQVETGQSRPSLHCKISGQNGTLRFIGERAMSVPFPLGSTEIGTTLEPIRGLPRLK